MESDKFALGADSLGLRTSGLEEVYLVRKWSESLQMCVFMGGQRCSSVTWINCFVHGKRVNESKKCEVSLRYLKITDWGTSPFYNTSKLTAYHKNEINYSTYTIEQYYCQFANQPAYFSKRKIKSVGRLVVFIASQFGPILSQSNKETQKLLQPGNCVSSGFNSSNICKGNSRAKRTRSHREFLSTG